MLYCIDYQINFKRRYNFGNAALRYRYLDFGIETIGPK